MERNLVGAYYGSYVMKRNNNLDCLICGPNHYFMKFFRGLNVPGGNPGCRQQGYFSMEEEPRTSLSDNERRPIFFWTLIW